MSDNVVAEVLPPTPGTTEVPTALLVSITRDLGALVQAQRSMESTHRRHADAEALQYDKLWKQYGKLLDRVQEMELMLSEQPSLKHEHMEFLHVMIEKEKVRARFWQKMLASLSEKGILAVVGASMVGLFFYAKSKLGGP